MKNKVLSTLGVLLVLASGAYARAGQVPEQISRARYVALGYDTGASFLTEREGNEQADKLLREDLDALRALRDHLENWDKYVVVDRPEEAEILFVVRAGRRAVLGVGVPLRGSASSPAGGPAGAASPSVTSYGGQLSSQGDMLTIYEARGGRPGIQLWRETHSAGFPSRLFDQFKADVERSPAPKKK
ncbi:MAG: hypothetical protein ABUL63_01780, partial [Acidobacteriota bacterium]